MGLTGLSGLSGCSGTFGYFYCEKVLGFGPRAYWPLWESSGVVAECLVNSAQNGTYSSDVSAWSPGAGIGDGNTAPYFDGASDYIDVYSSALASVWDGNVNTIVAWGRITTPGVWSDGQYRRILLLETDTADHSTMTRHGASAGNMLFEEVAGGVAKQVTGLTASTTDWFCMAQTNNRSADEFNGYLNGIQQGTTQNSLGNWSGSLVSTLCNIGCTDHTGPWSVWDGYIAHVILFDKILNQTQIEKLAIV